MLISTNRPPDITPALIGTGSAWLSSDNGAALFDGLPGRATRIQWLSGAQTTSSTLTIQATWATALVPRIVALLGLTLPVGLKVTVDFQKASTWGYQSTNSTVIAMNNGTNGAWIVLPEGLDAVTGVKVHMVNDVSGATAIDAGAAIDIGEMWVGSSATYKVLRSVQDALVDPSIRNRTLGQQVYVTKRLPYRTLSFDMSPVADADVDTTRVTRASCAQSVPAVLVLEDDHLPAAMFGNVTGFKLATENNACYWLASVDFEEIPNG